MRTDRRNSWLRGAFLASVVALTAFATGAQAQTYNLRVLHRFSDSPDGDSPAALVQFDAAGNLYGTTRFGGAHDKGVIFKIAKDRTETVVHSFDGEAGGAYPYDGVTIDPGTGDLYGTAYGGDSACDPYGCGVLYRQAADGTFTVLYTFDGGANGGQPSGRLLRDQQGNLYGTTEDGGINDYGTVYKFGADGSFTVLHRFAWADGADPAGGVIPDQAGNLYGVTYAGGMAAGTVYKLAPDGSVTTLHSFSGGADGSNPVDGLTGDEAGNLYGATDDGWGSVFRLAPDGTLTTLYEFTGGTDGGIVHGDLLLIGGNLYGTTTTGGYRDCHLGGQSLNCGVVFKIALAAAGSNYTVLHAFRHNGSGVGPLAGLTYKYGRLFGTTAQGGAGGAVYSVGVEPSRLPKARGQK